MGAAKLQPGSSHFPVSCIQSVGPRLVPRGPVQFTLALGRFCSCGASLPPKRIDILASYAKPPRGRLDFYGKFESQQDKRAGRKDRHLLALVYWKVRMETSIFVITKGKIQMCHSHSTENFVTLQHKYMSSS